MAGSLGGRWTDLWRELFDKAAINAQLAESSLIDWRRSYRDALITEWLPTRLGVGPSQLQSEILCHPSPKKDLPPCRSLVAGCAASALPKGRLMRAMVRYRSDQRVSVMTALDWPGRGRQTHNSVHMGERVKRYAEPRRFDMPRSRAGVFEDSRAVAVETLVERRWSDGLSRPDGLRPLQQAAHGQGAPTVV